MSQSKFLHEESYRGKDLVAKLANYRITILGVGALGSNLADTLARQGFSNLTVCDMDRVETQNISTQIWSEGDVGAFKAAALKNILFNTTGIEITAIAKEFTPSSAKKVLAGANLVVDCFDNSESRQLLQNECRHKNLPCLHAGLFEDFGQVTWDTAYKVPQNAEGDVCDYPLARNLITLTVAITAEEILSFCLDKTPRYYNWTVTLKDLAIRRF